MQKFVNAFLTQCLILLMQARRDVSWMDFRAPKSRCDSFAAKLTASSNTPPDVRRM